MTEKLKHRLPSALASSHFLAAAAYSALGLLLVSRYQHLMYKDEISYVTIAERYATGDLATAPNAYWGPLLSWLLAGLLLTGLPAALAAKLLSLSIGLVTFFAVKLLSDVFEIGGRLKGLLFLLLIPFLLYCSLIFFTPDLLLACVLTFYFSLILSSRYAERRYAGVWCGVLGALAYFGKGYALPFFLIHFPLFNLIHYLMNKEKTARRMVWRHCAFGLMAFAALAAVWVYLLYGKYHEVTAGITGKYNYAIVGTESSGRPIFYVGFVRPPDSATVSIWEDPYYFYSLPEAGSCCLKPWWPLDSWRAFKHQVKLILTNAVRTISAYQGFSILSVVIIAACLALCFAPRRSLNSRLRRTLAFALATLGLYPAGYMLVYSEERYLWAMLILILLMGVCLLHLLFQTRLFANWVWKAAAVALFSVSFLVMPVDQLQRRAYVSRTTDMFCRLLENENLSGASIASNVDYGGAVCVSYHLRAKYYGMARPNISNQGLVEEMRRQGIGHYFAWDAPPIAVPGLEMIKKFEAGGRSLTLYSVKP